MKFFRRNQEASSLPGRANASTRKQHNHLGAGLLGTRRSAVDGGCPLSFVLPMDAPSNRHTRASLTQQPSRPSRGGAFLLRRTRTNTRSSALCPPLLYSFTLVAEKGGEITTGLGGYPRCPMPNDYIIDEQATAGGPHCSAANKSPPPPPPDRAARRGASFYFRHRVHRVRTRNSPHSGGYRARAHAPPGFASLFRRSCDGHRLAPGCQEDRR